MPTIADSAARILAAGVPVVFLDTCILLDVIRAPARGLANCVEAASELLGQVTASPVECTVVVGSFVPSEWGEHEKAVVELLTGHLDRMQHQAIHFHALCIHLGIDLPFSRPDYSAGGMAERLHELSRRLLDASLVLDRDHAVMARAYDRVAVSKRRPCRRGGELKDCQIFEECLEVGRLLRSSGFTQKIVFCTSNTEDYCAPGIVPHADVSADCIAVGFVFTTSLSWAVNELKT